MTSRVVTIFCAQRAPFKNSITNLLVGVTNTLTLERIVQEAQVKCDPLNAKIVACCLMIYGGCATNTSLDANFEDKVLFEDGSIVVNQPYLLRDYGPEMRNEADPVGTIGPIVKGSMIEQPNRILLLSKYVLLDLFNYKNKNVHFYYVQGQELETALESVIVKSIDFGYDEGKTPLQSVSFKSQDTEPTILQSDGFGKMSIEKTVSFRTMENAMEFSKTSSEEKHKFNEFRRFPVEQIDPRHRYGHNLHFYYVQWLHSQSKEPFFYWLDIGEGKEVNIVDKCPRWKLQQQCIKYLGPMERKAYEVEVQDGKLLFPVEQIDPRHRYGHNLHFYYVQWLHSQSKEPFFYWLDIGEGKEVNIVDKCPRWKLQQQCIKYLGPMERKAYEVEVQDGKLLYKETGKLLNTTDEPKGAKWIFVLSTSKTLYIGKKTKGTLQHSSFLAGGATLAAGRIVAEQGVLKAVWPHSGHYRPTPENFQDFVSFMRENNVDLNDVKLDSDEDEEESIGKKSGVFLRGNSSEDDLRKDVLETEANDLEESTSEKSDLKVQQNDADIQLVAEAKCI
uniref:Uncharacterized protein LOC104249451 n=1 Tax=Nicotiana sylvestris TaxID=4096 RepID=A0A1U7YJB5_NICSY|nr:PREDICTED: uncharacterized protein LOC104249451 [Nicotiana sylvestris]